MTSTTTRPARRRRAAVEPTGPARPAGRPDLPPPAADRAGLGGRARLLAVVLAGAFGGEFKADYSAPGSDSSAAQTLLEDEFPAKSGDTVDVVVHADGPATAAAVRTDVRALLTKLAAVPHVVGVDDPYATPGGGLPRRPHARGARPAGRREPAGHAGRGQPADARRRRRGVPTGG